MAVHPVVVARPEAAAHLAVVAVEQVLLRPAVHLQVVADADKVAARRQADLLRQARLKVVVAVQFLQFPAVAHHQRLAAVAASADRQP